MEQFPEWSPFHGMQISSHLPLNNNTATTRYTCPTCHQSRRYYCYKCAEAAPGITPPRVRLPIPRLTVVKDPRELDGKSTAVQAKIVCPDQVCIVSSLDYHPVEYSSTVVLFPSADAKGPGEVEWGEVENVVVIEGTWSQAKAIEKTLPREIMRVTLPTDRKTAFWRYQQLGEHCLSTVEAMHALMSIIGGDCDNLLWFFSHQYHLIQQYYQHTDRPFTHRHRQDYIVHEK